MDRIDREIWLHLTRLNIPTNLRGYTLLRQAIKAVYNDPDLIHQATTCLYPMLAQLHKTTWHNVERRVRYAVSYVLKNADPNIAHEYFGAANKLTNMQFISGVVEYIKATNPDV